MACKEYIRLHVTHLKFSIRKVQFFSVAKDTHAWYISVLLPDGSDRCLQWLPNGKFRLSYEIGNCIKKNEFFSSPGWYETRSWARYVVHTVKHCNTIRCEV